MELEKILFIISRAIDDINVQLPKKKKLSKSPDTVLLGKGGTLDSLGLVTLIVAIEQKIVEELGISIVLTNQDVLSTASDKFATIESLARYVSELAAKGKGLSDGV